jgi:hypothetical protein
MLECWFCFPPWLPWWKFSNTQNICRSLPKKIRTFFFQKKEFHSGEEHFSSQPSCVPSLHLQRLAKSILKLHRITKASTWKKSSLVETNPFKERNPDFVHDESPNSHSTEVFRHDFLKFISYSGLRTRSCCKEQTSDFAELLNLHDTVLACRCSFGKGTTAESETTISRGIQAWS